HATEMYHKASHEFEALGIVGEKPRLDLAKMMAHKEATVEANVKGVEFLFKKNKIETLRGTGSVLGVGKVRVSGADGSEKEIEARNIVIATGSDVAGIPGVELEFDEE